MSAATNTPVLVAPSGQEIAGPRIGSSLPSYSFDSLPADILPLIFVFLSEKTRLRVVHRVCRRWRTASRLSIKTPPTRDVVKALQCFPAIEILQIRKPIPAGTPLPRTLRCIFISRYSSEDACYCASFAGLSSLTKLDAPLMPNCPCVVRLAVTNTASLTSLRIKPFGIGRPVAEYQTALASLKIPTLRMLALDFDGNESCFGGIISLLQRHLPSLQKLTLALAGTLAPPVEAQLRTALSSTVAANLHSIKFLVRHAPVALLAALRLAAPNLRELKMRASSMDDVPAVLQLASPVLVSLNSSVQLPDLSILTQCTKLRELNLQNVVELSEHHWLPHASRLTELSPFPHADEQRAVQLLTALKMLHLRTSLPALQPMPQLAFLLLPGSFPFADLLAYMHSCLQLCPRLSELVLTDTTPFTDTLSDTELAQLCAFLRLADARNLAGFSAAGVSNKIRLHLKALEKELGTMTIAVPA